MSCCKNHETGHVGGLCCAAATAGCWVPPKRAPGCAAAQNNGRAPPDQAVWGRVACSERHKTSPHAGHRQCMNTAVHRPKSRSCASSMLNHHTPAVRPLHHAEKRSTLQCCCEHASCNQWQQWGKGMPRMYGTELREWVRPGKLTLCVAARRAGAPGGLWASSQSIQAPLSRPSACKALEGLSMPPKPCCSTRIWLH